MQLGAALTLTVNAGITLNISTALGLFGNSIFATTIQSSSAAAAYLIYSGTRANADVNNITFTWIDASGSAQAIDNYYGGTLSNTINIVNRTTVDYSPFSQADRNLLIGTYGIKLDARDVTGNVNAQVKGQDNIDFGALQKNISMPLLLLYLLLVILRSGLF